VRRLCDGAAAAIFFCGSLLRIKNATSVTEPRRWRAGRVLRRQHSEIGRRATTRFTLLGWLGRSPDREASVVRARTICARRTCRVAFLTQTVVLTPFAHRKSP